MNIRKLLYGIQKVRAVKLMVYIFVLGLIFVFLGSEKITNFKALANDETNYIVSSEDDIKNAIESINAKESGEYTITPNTDIVINKNLELKKNSVTIRGENHTLSLVTSYISASGGSVLNLGSEGYNKILCIKEKPPETGNACTPLISIGNATLNMFKGVTISGRNGVDTAGGVQLNGNSTFNMYGGEISDCRSDSTAGGVLVYNNSKFKMTDGTIKNCESSNSGGGVFVRDSSTFEIEGGTIQNCNAARSGGGVYVYNSQFKVAGGTIQNCHSTNYGGGIYSNSKFEMTGGTIKGCTNSTYGGAGVCIRTPNATDIVGLDMSGGEITDCTATSNINYGLGGGVLVINGLAEIKDGSKIYNNHASLAGDDVFSFGTNAKLKLSDVPEGLILSETGHAIDGWYVDGVINGEDTARWDKDNFAQKYVPSPEEVINTQIALKAAHGPINYNYYDYTLKYYIDGKLNEELTQTGTSDTVHVDNIEAPDKCRIDSIDYVNVVEPTSDTPGSFEVNVYCSKSTVPTKELRCTTELDGQTLNVILQDPNHALPDDVYLKVTSISKNTSRWNELRSQLGYTGSTGNLAFFNIELLYKSNDEPVKPMPLPNNVKILFQIPNGWDKEDLKVVLIMSGAENVEFDKTITNIDGDDYVAFWTKYFAPYALVGKLTDQEAPSVDPQDSRLSNRNDIQKSPQTGESDSAVYLILDMLLVSSIVIFIVTFRRKRKVD